MTLLQGDCLELMKTIPAGSVDMVLADIPYGTTACKWDVVIPFEPMWAELKRVTKENAAICLFGVEPFSATLRVSNLKEYRYDWYWSKSRSGNFMMANKQPHKKIECISVFYRKQPTYNPQKRINPNGPEKRSQYLASEQKKYDGINVATSVQRTKPSSKYEADKLLPCSLLEFSQENSPVHPTQKPVTLLEYMIKTYTNEGETVLDFTMGSGSTGVAAKNLNREFIGIELDESYYGIARKRIEGA